MTFETLVLRVLLVEESGVWIAQGVDLDIAAQSASQTSALDAFERVVEAQARLDKLHGKSPLAEVPPPPEQVLSRWENARRGERASVSVRLEP